VVAVLIEQGGGGGTAAAPVARAIMEAYFGSKPAGAVQSGRQTVDEDTFPLD